MCFSQSKTIAAAAIAFTFIVTGTSVRAQETRAPSHWPEARTPARTLEVWGTQERDRPRLEGIILRIDPNSTVAEVGVGTEGGVIPGQEFMVYRPSPKPQYIGKLVIVATKPERSLGILVDRRPNQEMKEGDRIIEAKVIGPSFKIIPL
jgi:hypothetical protein